ncbi:MAG: TIGR02597 family protein [Verrucomicrobiota bacterium]
MTYFFSNNVDGTTGNVGWRLVGDNTTNHGDDALLPDSYFVVRNQNGAPTLPLVSLGSVLLKKLTVPLLTSTSSAQDNPVSIVRPLDVTLNATGLNLTDGSFVANDQLLLFDNTQVGFDKSPSAIYYQDSSVANGRWRLVGDNLTDHGGDLIAMGTGFIIRKATTASGQPAFWTNSFPLQAVSAVSRKTHGTAGDFDINLPLSGPVGIECRNAGAGGTHQIIINFASPVTMDGAIVTSGSGSISSSSVSGSVVTVNLTGVTNAQTTVVTLLQANDGVNRADVAIRMGVLAGDTNGDSFVNSGDALQTRNRSGQATGSANFRSDLNVDGFVNSGDTFIVRSRSGTFLP